ncbi:MAG: DUF3667 domain-containing protein [Bacteroidetes bacterium]|nr:DUF3667 domain-containing protein [Bacteroidota bacterium]
MHHEKEEIVCPNCGTHVSGNYCYECGQSNHLHRDTFAGLIFHFFEHYFHYDNKFWQTIRTLLFKPGELTVAYWKQQRMRYISPISLYVFVSAVYFTLGFILFPTQQKKGIEAAYSIRSMAPVKIAYTKDSLDKEPIAPNSTAAKFKNPEFVKAFTEKIVHTFPKIFFLMIPFTALLLKLLFIRRRDIYFVDHIIFSLHYHSFYFLAGLFAIILGTLPLLAISILVGIGVYVLEFLYFVKGLKVVYNISSGRSVLYTITIGFCYLLTMGSISYVYVRYLLNHMS